MLKLLLYRACAVITSYRLFPYILLASVAIAAVLSFSLCICAHQLSGRRLLGSVYVGLKEYFIKTQSKYTPPAIEAVAEAEEGPADQQAVPRSQLAASEQARKCWPVRGLVACALSEF